MLTRAKRKAENLELPYEHGIDVEKTTAAAAAYLAEALAKSEKRWQADPDSQHEDVNAVLHAINKHRFHGRFCYVKSPRMISFYPDSRDFPEQNPRPDWLSDEGYKEYVKSWADEGTYFTMDYNSAKNLAEYLPSKILEDYEEYVGDLGCDDKPPTPRYLAMVEKFKKKYGENFKNKHAG